jgi:hypothetical protein
MSSKHPESLRVEPDDFRVFENLFLHAERIYSPKSNSKPIKRIDVSY